MPLRWTLKSHKNDKFDVTYVFHNKKSESEIENNST